MSSAFLRFCYRHVFVIACWLIWLDLRLLPGLLDPESGLSVVAASTAVMFTAMLGCVFAVVRWADQLAEILGEPLGTLVLTLSATLIEGSLMLTVMATGGENPTILRDTVFATLMVVLNGMVGLALAAGGWRHREQAFNLRGAIAFLHLIAPLSLIILVIPNFTRSSSGPTLAPIQEAFLGVLCVSVYALFLVMQSTRHRALFDHQEAEHRAHSLHSPAAGAVAGGNSAGGALAIGVATVGLLVAIAPIVLLAEHLGSVINFGIESFDAPPALGGLLITTLVLAPEGLGALKAALANRMQRAVNICLGSALATIALTVPAVLLAAAYQHRMVTLGLDDVNRLLLFATLLTAMNTFVSGRSTLLQGNVHLMLFVTYLFFILYP